MRALAIALLGMGMLLGACTSPAVQTIPPETSVAKFERLKKRWEELQGVTIARYRGDSSQPPADPKTVESELRTIFAEVALLAPEVPGAIEFCIDSAPRGWTLFAFEVPAAEVIQDLVRDHPDNELLAHYLWGTWNGTVYFGERGNEVLASISKMVLPGSASLSRGWRRLAQVVLANGIGGPSPWSHDARLARRQLAELEEDYAGTIVAVHARELARGLEIASEAPAEAEFALVDLTGNPIDLKPKRGRPVLLLFWAPGRDDLRALLASTFERRDWHAEVVAVAVGAEADVTREQLQVDSFRVELARLANPQAAAFSVAGLSQLPLSLVIDREGRLCAANMFGKALSLRLADLQVAAR